MTGFEFPAVMVVGFQQIARIVVFRNILPLLKTIALVYLPKQPIAHFINKVY
jgi:hypothetical protein